MRILDRYLTWEFFKVYWICFFSLVGLYLVFDVFANLDKFIFWTDSTGELLSVMGEYYYYRLLVFFMYCGAYVTLIAAMFTITWFKNNNELVALWAAGISNRRIIWPLLIAGALISGSLVYVQEGVLPQYKSQLMRTTKDLKGKLGLEFQPRYDQKTDILMAGTAAYADRKRIDRPSFMLPPTLAGRNASLTAAEAFYEPPTGDRPGGYRFPHVREPEDLTTQPSLRLNRIPVVLTPVDTPWLDKGSCFVVSEMPFEQLTGGDAWRRYSSTWDLIQGLHNPSLDYGNRVRVQIHGRMVQPILDVTLILLGLPFVLATSQRTVYVSIAICLVIVGLFVLVKLAAQSLGSLGILSPALSAWLPALIFVPLAVYLTDDLWKS